MREYNIKKLNVGFDVSEIGELFEDEKLVWVKWWKDDGYNEYDRLGVVRDVENDRYYLVDCEFVEDDYGWFCELSEKYSDWRILELCGLCYKVFKYIGDSGYGENDEYRWVESDESDEFDNWVDRVCKK